MASKLSLLTALLGLANAQRPGSTPEVHPKLITSRCTLKDGCKPATNYIVLDSLAHPLHQKGNNFNCGDWGQAANATACPDVESCRDNCIMEGIPDYSKHAVTTSGSDLKITMFNDDGNFISPRVYLLDETEHKYEMLHLTGQEFTFEVDARKLPCGMNSALYLSEMEAEGGKSDINPGGAYYGTGYCDAQCFTTPFINGVGNLDGKGSCCNEMDIWEANSRATHVAPHTCNKPGVYLCEGEECTSTGVCDKPGCGWNPYRVNITDYYGNSDDFKVDTSRSPITVITQFPADPATGKLKAIKRMYVQDGKLIKAHEVDMPGLPKTNVMDDEFCAATGAEHYLRLGGTVGMGESLSRGMVLAMSIWWDEGGNMKWLDSIESGAGPCNATEGAPSFITTVEKNPEVTYSNLRWGDIGSTFQAGCAVKRRRGLSSN
ncbi:endoglucanase EG-1 [Rhypophila sp. PSN 637]